jgi:hypothetical protein
MDAPFSKLGGFDEIFFVYFFTPGIAAILYEKAFNWFLKEHKHIA